MKKKIKGLQKTGNCICLLALLLLAYACQQPAKNKRVLSSEHKRANIKYATGFDIDYYHNYKLLSIYSGRGNKSDTLRYILIRHGDTAPEGYSRDQIIHIPIKNLVTTSSTHVAQAEFAGVADRIIGLGSLTYVNSSLVRKNIAAGKVKEVGVDGAMNDELIISMHPDLVVVMTNPDSEYAKYRTLTNAGVPVLPNSEWLETSPLGKAEWVKVMGALTNTEQMVNNKFARIEKEYLRLADIGSKAKIKKAIISGMPYKGVWSVPEGNSYMAQFFRDAGVSYKWMTTKGTGSLALNFEVVAPEAISAEYWLNPGFVDTRKDIQALDNRYASFKPFKSGKIFNYNKRVNDLGSNDYWESGTVNPDVILADLIHIVHPELLPDHHLVYYKQLP